MTLTTPQTYLVACLAGHGIGPEVTAAASRALERVSRQHGFRIDEIHPAFDTEAFAQSGHSLPAAARRAIESAEAILVAGATAPALEWLKAALSPVVRVTRTLDETGDSTVFASLDEAAPDLAIARGFAAARASSGRLSSVGVGEAWRRRVEVQARDHAGVQVTHLSLADALEQLASGSAGVLVAESVVGDAAGAAPRLGGRVRLTATAELSATGTGLFGPTHGTAHEAAGQGMADPSEMLLATALLLSEGFGRRAAGEALEQSLTEALRGARRASAASGTSVTATTREFVDAVLGLLPSARRDTEFAMGVTG